ncbi:hypothetical protein L228DRAFT_130108 [Xylona heveae TC161]|uniref:non-specific serine/threonine protein kinase n=1 Tax=Xylona heveae (strain CBS 132557 / TC161) TaxID=1328760 RepID=A0A165GUV8_XYLHT|nr:hypothetical protein L228DRAFT_130108 [Xylona heveae TC161]KZF22623.1 hypothetical protein L228DRAFT_130108 [Xylona heveae TC161]
MASDSPDYKRLFREERQRREEAERREKSETRLREEAERREQSETRLREEAERREQSETRLREEAERRREEAESVSRKTTLPEYLDACHRYLCLGLTIQNADSSTQGSPANAKDKVRPHKIVAWTKYAEVMGSVWEHLRQNPDFFEQRWFSSLSHLQGSGQAIRRKQISSEVDLSYYATNTVENQVEEVVNLVYAHPTLREQFHVEGTVSFESHGNMLSGEAPLEDDFEQMTLTGAKERPRRSNRLAQRHPPRIEAPLVTVERTRPPPTHADRICVYRKVRPGLDNHQVDPLFPIEYKPPHKVPLGLIMEGLGDMDVDQVLRIEPDESLHEKRRYVVAAIITQAYSYMIKTGLAYGYVYTGEAIIFLHVPEHNYSTVQYFLSVPQEDVGKSTGWSANDTHRENKLHLTSVGQVLAFTLQALATPVRGSAWRRNAQTTLPRWTAVLEELLEEAETTSPLAKGSPSSDYQPSPRQPGEEQYMRMSPVMTRARRALLPGRACHPFPEHPTRVDDGSDDDDDTLDTETPTRPAVQRTSRTRSTAHQEPPAGAPSSESPSGAVQDRPYCTQACLRGLQQGRPLDEHCPNVRYHQQGHHNGNRHRISRRTFLRLLHHELVGTTPLLKELGIHGASGCLVKVVLGSHGYTMVAKGTTAPFFGRLKHEAAIYRHLDALQGEHIPVCLGAVDMRTAPLPYWGWDLADVVHLLVLSFAGQPMHRCAEVGRTQLQAQAQAALRAIRARNVEHKDVAARNIVYNAETQQVQILDFERAVIGGHSVKEEQHLKRRRFILGAISPNLKRKKGSGPGQKSRSAKRSFETPRH